ncbi:MAG: thioesterase [Bacteroidales bacterium]|nr:thioesterase [Bacteroidales bacterium]
MDNYKKIVVGEPFSMPYRVTFADMDAEYRLSLESILGYFQDAAASYLALRHVAAFDLQAEGNTWVITDYNVEICGDLPMWRDDVVTEICPSEVSGVKIYFDFRVMGKNGDVAAKGTCCWSAINVASARPVALPNLMTVEGSTTVKHDRMLYPAVELAASEYSRLANRSDIDFNDHVNNISYVKIALSGMPAELMHGTVLKKLSIKFIRQSFLGEELVCRYSAPDGLSTNCSIVNGSGQEVCRLVIAMEPKPERPSIRETIVR